MIELSYNSLAGEPVGTIEYTPDGDGVVETPLDVHVKPFGLGWTFSLGPSLLILDNTLFTGVQVRYPDGRTVNFAASGGGFTPDDTRVYDTLTADGGGYLLKRKDLTQYRFDADGKLTQHHRSQRQQHQPELRWRQADPRAELGRPLGDLHPQR